MGTIKYKVLDSVKPNDLKYANEQITLSVIGRFDTDSVKWTYYACSHTQGRFTDDINSRMTAYDVAYVTNGKQFKERTDAVKYIEDFKDKWESGLNDTSAQRRVDKINEALDEE